MSESDWLQRRYCCEEKRLHEPRRPYDIDLGRIIHSAAFRRLQGKTQVLGMGEGDFHRTRLTHSMEVAQIGRGIVNHLCENEHKISNETNLCNNLMEAICLAHDLGHPPFGHGGEIALNYAMHDYGGFEANGQNLRLLSRLEAHTENYGLNLTRRTMLGILKYPVSYIKFKKSYPTISTSYIRSKDWKPPKCYLDSEADIVDWLLHPFSQNDRDKLRSYESMGDKIIYHRSIDASIMEIADDIAYGVHDLEDAIALNLITCDMFDDPPLREYYDDVWGQSHGLNSWEELMKKLFSKSSHERKYAIGSLVYAFVLSVEIREEEGFENELLRYQAVLQREAKNLLDQLEKLIRNKVIYSHSVKTLEYRGILLVKELFELLSTDPERLLTDNFKRMWGKALSKNSQMRIICDYVAGMTDEYATRIYERFFIPRHGTIFEKL